MLDKINDFVNEPLPRKILFFDDMLTPSLIRGVYWLGLLAVIWTGLGRMFSHGFFGIFEALVYIAIGIIVLRVISELVMLLFKIHDNIELVAENTKESKTAKASPAKRKTTKKVTKKA